MRLPRPNATPVQTPRQGNVSEGTCRRVGVWPTCTKLRQLSDLQNVNAFSEKNLPLRPARRHAHTPTRRHVSPARRHVPPALSILSDGKCHDKGRPFTGAALDGDGPTMSLHRVLDDGQTEPRAACVS
jgi:hypothetical protein